MKLLLRTACCGVMLILISSCARVYYSPDAATVARTHKFMAILPPAVSMLHGMYNSDRDIAEKQKSQALVFQHEMHAWILQRKMQGYFPVGLQDIQTTNAVLSRLGYPEKAYTPAELCYHLGVEGLLISNFQLSKPMDETAAIALAVFAGVFVKTNEVHANLSIHDGAGQKIIWNYANKYSGSVGSTPARLVDRLMKNASNKMPYFR